MSDNPFVNFNSQAQGILTLSYQILMEWRHNQLDVEHILMALLEHRNGVLPQVLEISNIKLNALHKAVQDKLATISKMTSPNLEGGANVGMYITLNLVNLFRETEAEWNRQGTDTVGPEHILLAMVSLADHPAAQLLRQFGLDKPKVLAALPQVDFTEPTPNFLRHIPKLDEEE